MDVFSECDLTEPPYLQLMSARQTIVSRSLITCLRWSFVMSFSHRVIHCCHLQPLAPLLPAGFSCRPLCVDQSEGALEAPRPSRPASAGSSCPSVISADRHADGQNAGCGSHNQRASTMRRTTFISNLRVEKHNRKEGGEAAIQLLSLFAPIRWLHQGEQNKRWT